MSDEKLLEVSDLRTYFHTPRGVVKAVDGVSFSIDKGKTLCLVGESGCGKSVASLSIMRLLSSPGRVEGGRILFDGRDLLALSEAEMRGIRGARISMIFQEPMTSLNPAFTVGDQIAEVLEEHSIATRSQARERAVELLKLVGIPEPEKRADEYPHRLSGGMRQRVMIAMALASPKPELLIADEPTTALDVTIQAQILDLMRDLQSKIGMSILLITHNMGVVSEMADTVAVLYAGKKVEEAGAGEIFSNPLHPYTRALLNSIPSNPKYRGARRLEAIPGSVPSPGEVGPGCPFMNRCERAGKRCAEFFPAVRTISPTHAVWCHDLGQS
jgi:oligopeptide/dipeptide ABC transporter ATP-binding protein